MRLWTRRAWLTLAALSGFLAVAMGAFAAHGLDDPSAQDWMRTGAQYAAIHALATFACAGLMQLGAGRARLAAAFFLGGTALFSGSLYAMALGAPRGLAAVIPVGGLLFLIGWLTLAWAAWGVDKTP